jgi:predicted RNase H-like HicB family nuclease
MQFEVEVVHDGKGEWTATAVEHGVSVTGRTEAEALARMMDALTAHFKKSGKRSDTPSSGASSTGSIRS